MANSHNYCNYKQPLCPTTDKSTSTILLFTGLKSRFFPVRNRWQRQIDAETLNRLCPGLWRGRRSLVSP
jgi:hypothetical protein